jgi:tetratricopeptide (TPR) repeat protein
MKKEYDKSEEMYKRVVDLAPMYLDEALFNLAMVQEKSGKLEESLLNLRQAVTVNPKNALAIENLERVKKKTATR